MAAYIVVDWGTSSFRAWSLDQDGDVLAGVASAAGKSTLQGEAFNAVLQAALEELSSPGDAPVLICGMAGAKDGWVEAAYADTATSLNDLPKAAVAAPFPNRDVRILPGMKQDGYKQADIMRGEETLLMAMGLEDGSVCLPGTHSKWVRLTDGRVESFRTFMTGETFALLKDQSVLSTFTGPGSVDVNSAAFVDAAKEAFDDPASILADVFNCRAAPMLGAMDGGDPATSRLSGLLIGSELAGAKSQGFLDGATVQLVTSGGLGEAYQSALLVLGVGFNVVPADDLAVKGLFAAASRLWPERTA